MGAQVSSIELDSNYYLGVISSTIINISHQCASSNIQSQNLNITARGNIDLQNISLNQQSTINLTCLQDLSSDIQNKTDLIQDIVSKIENEVKDQTIGGQIANTSKITNAVTEVVNNLNYDSLTSCLSQNAQEQNVLLSADGNVYVSGLDLSQTTDLLQDCIQNDSQTFGNITKLQQTVEEEVKSSTSGFLNTGSLIVIAIIVFIVLLIVGLVIYMIKGGGAKAVSANASTTVKNTVQDVAQDFAQSMVSSALPQYFGRRNAVVSR